MPCDPLLLTCLGVAHDLPLLPHFLAHYRGLGVSPDRMHVLLNSTDPEEPRLEQAEDILRTAGAHAERWIAPYTSATMWEARRDLQRRHARPDDWVISADVDEFHEYPASLASFLAICDAVGVTCVQGVFIDRLAADGILAPVRDSPFVLDQFPIQAEVGFSIAGKGKAHDRYGTVKIMAMRGRVLPSKGGHHPLPGEGVVHLYGRPLGHFAMLENPHWRFRLPTRVHHVHWTDTLPERLRIRLATPGASEAGREYGTKQLRHFADHGGVSLEYVTIRDARVGDSRSGWRNHVALLRGRATAMNLADRLRAPFRRLKRA